MQQAPPKLRLCPSQQISKPSEPHLNGALIRIPQSNFPDLQRTKIEIAKQTMQEASNSESTSEVGDKRGISEKRRMQNRAAQRKYSKHHVPTSECICLEIT